MSGAIAAALPALALPGLALVGLALPELVRPELAVPGAWIGSGVAWQPAEGLVLERSASMALDLVFEDGSAAIMHQKAPLEATFDGLDTKSLSVAAEVDYSLVQTVEALDGSGWPSRVRLEFGAMFVDGEEIEDGGPEIEVDAATFVWDTAEEVYRVELDSDEVASDEATEMALSIGLEDQDCRWLLPAGEVEVGDSWTLDLDLQRLVELLAFPGSRA